MPDEKEFPTGLFVSRPKPNAKTGKMPPAFIVGRISIRVDEFLDYLSTKGGKEWLRIDIKEGFNVDEETGQKKWYAQVDKWVKPSERVEEKEEGDDGLPF